MASICRDPGGRRRILFVDKNGDRKAIWLGKVTQHTAEEVCRRVEALANAAVMNTAIDRDTAAWLVDVGDDLHAKLARVGLVAPRKPTAPKPTLDSFLRAWLAKRESAKPNSRTNYRQAIDKLTSFFGAAAPLDTVTPAQAEDFARDMAGKHAKEWTWRLVKFARQFFKDAVRDNMVAANPFEGIKPPAQATKSRQFFVSRALAKAVLDACPDAEWRLIFALARFGGLRIPSELLPLTWHDVDWERGRFRVKSPKTEHHDDGGERWTPLFPELLPHFQDAFDAAPDGATHVIRRYRGTNANLRTQLERIIRRAALKPWPKLFHNLRATRQTELEETFPTHVVCAWLGNSPRIAHKHYLQVTEDHFDRARNSAPDSAPTAQNAAQQAAAAGRKLPQQSTQLVQGVEETCISADNLESDKYTRQESNLQPMAP